MPEQVAIEPWQKKTDISVQDCTTAMAKADQIVQELARMQDVGEVKTAANLLEVIRLWATRAVKDRRLANKFLADGIKAQRRLGELIADLPRGKAGRPMKNEVRPRTQLKKIVTDEFGLRWDYAIRCQKYAKRLTEDEIESILAAANADDAAILSHAYMRSYITNKEGGTPETPRRKQRWVRSQPEVRICPKCGTPTVPLDEFIKTLESRGIKIA
jgi:hypothetical protein